MLKPKYKVNAHLISSASIIAVKYVCHSLLWIMEQSVCLALLMVANVNVKSN